MKNKRLIICLIVLIVILIIISAKLIGSRQSTPVVENPTNIEELKQSEYTSSAFDEVELGESKTEVEAEMGNLEAVEMDSDYDAYSVTDDGTQYIFFFSDDKLENVTVFLAE